MNESKTKDYKSIIIIALLLVIIMLLVFKNYKPATKDIDTPKNPPAIEDNRKPENNTGNKEMKPENNNQVNDIDQLTKTDVVVAFVKKHVKLPDYYITKQQARRRGWNASKGNLCNVLPGKAIGGDIFTNREGQLPQKKGRKWFEADLNYNCGHRNADRLLFSSDGLLLVTFDHYKTFTQK
ncbi:MAG: ribonuclease domain-containing protein [Ferruginibacter sp.]|jgi:hypothetical protein